MRPNVVQLIPSFNQGGSERQAVQLAELLAGNGSCNVRLACLSRTGPLLDRAVAIDSEGVPEFPLTSFMDRNFLKQVRRFAAWLRTNEIHIVQTHDFYTNIFGITAAWYAGVPGRIAAKRETGMRSRSQLLAERQMFRMAGMVLVNSERVRRYLLDAGVSEHKLEVVYNGIDVRRFAGGFKGRAEVLSEFGIPSANGPRLVTLVANLRHRVKNHEMFLRSARRVADIFDDARFVLAGEGERMGLITQMAWDLGLFEKVLFVGRCVDVPSLLSVSEIGVLTSDSEGFSNSILEYMAAGLPVVATNVGGASEAIVEGKTGFLVSPDDDAEMAKRIGWLLEDPDRAQATGERGRARVAEKFSVQKQIDGTLAIYERALGNGACRNL